MIMSTSALSTPDLRGAKLARAWTAVRSHARQSVVIAPDLQPPSGAGSYAHQSVVVALNLRPPSGEGSYARQSVVIALNLQPPSGEGSYARQSVVATKVAAHLAAGPAGMQGVGDGCTVAH